MTSVAPFEAAGVRGHLHRPEGAPRGDVVLAHGAGGNCEAPVLVAAAEALAGAGFCVLRVELPFRRKRAKGPPPRGSGPEDRAGLRAAAQALREMEGGGSVVLGGHSYGGRQASILAAEEPGLADALLLLSYPLHPPTKPGELRTGHFQALSTPCIFVHGRADPFGSIAELETAAAVIPGGAAILPLRAPGTT